RQMRRDDGNGAAGKALTLERDNSLPLSRPRLVATPNKSRVDQPCGAKSPLTKALTSQRTLKARVLSLIRVKRLAARWRE
ncbi:MAG TPA: hypothetical protein VN956_21255, partial [Pyrinomonadaceae bacterium]|nr:hypothetical protein [Pyrinomonadaceae bacterium]